MTEVAPIKFEPWMSTLLPADPLVGVNELIVGACGGQGVMYGEVLAPVPAGVVTAIWPVVAEPGAVAWISESESTANCALMPLKVTSVAPVKLEPWMSTLIPTGPHVGVNELIVGVTPNGS